MSEEWAQEDLPGYTLEEAMVLSVVGLNSGEVNDSPSMKEVRLTEFLKWFRQLDSGEDDPQHMKAKRWLWLRRVLEPYRNELRNRQVVGRWQDDLR